MNIKNYLSNYSFSYLSLNETQYKNIALGENDEDEIAYWEETFKEVTRLEKKDKITNQFHFIERATQTKNNDTTETEAQTDPPPMYSLEGL